jgi:isopentenyl-diphosphate delta-isomerase
MKKEYVILVDEKDREIDIAEKMDAHERGLLHRAFSVVLFDRDNPELTLLQQRAAGKYHCPLLWANACCSHQRKGESAPEAAARRVKEELGLALDPAALLPAGTFIYRAEVGDLIEHELDHVVIGFIENKSIPFNEAEIASVEWVSAENLPFRKYVPWLDKVLYKALETRNATLRKVAV